MKKISKQYKGLVIKKFNDYYLVELNENLNLESNNIFLCKIRKSVNFKNQLIFVGDNVIINQIDFKSKRATIESLLERDNLLDRPSVANITNIYITFSVEEPKLNLSQVSRFLLSAEHLGVEVSLVLTKCDLITEDRRLFLVDKFNSWGYKVNTLDCNSSNNFIHLLGELKKKKCSIFVGPSGVGKTTLLNQIIPGLKNTTAPVSSKIKRGKNTTRNVELFSLSKESFIVDSPGFNMRMPEIDVYELPNLFPEIRKQIAIEGLRCKFRNCQHINDKGCELNKNFERYIFYKEMVDSFKNQYFLSQED